MPSCIFPNLATLFNLPQLNIMKDEINKLTEAQSKELLDVVLHNYEVSVYAENYTEKMLLAEKLGTLKNKIETLAKSNNQ